MRGLQGPDTRQFHQGTPLSVVELLFSPMSNLSGAVHPTGSPVVGSPTAMGTSIPAMASLMSLPGLVPPPPAAVDPVAVQAAWDPSFWFRQCSSSSRYLK